MMKSPVGVRRVILVVLDGLRPETVDDCHLSHVQRLAYGGAWTNRAEPSLPVGHEPRFRDVLDRLTTELGAAGSRFVGRDAEFSLHIAQPTLIMQRRGLIVMHWPDAERAANEYGYASARYRAAASQVDEALAVLAAQLEVPRDPSTLLMVVSDHVRFADDQPMHRVANERELLIIAGGPVAQSPLPKTVSLLDVAPTIRWVLGFGGSGPSVALREAFRQARDTTSAFAGEMRSSPQL